MDRTQKIVRTSIVGIVMNLILVAFKMVVGLVSGSIAVILDAVNNLSDALSSIITIVGTKLAGRRPDKKHPYGYGRIEYLTGMLIAVIVLFAGLTSLKESVEKVIHPEAASYTPIMLVIIVVGIAAKFLTGRYVKSVGESINSQALVASGSDAYFDAVLSFGTLIAAGASMLWGLKLEGILGAVISVIIIKAGVEMLLETLNSITGERADPEQTKALREKVESYEGVLGAYDLVMHNYGPTSTIASIHIEVPDEMTAREIHKLTRTIAVDVYAAFGVILTVGIYAANDSDQRSGFLHENVERIVKQYPEILQLHGFYVDHEQKRVMFDLIVDFAADADAILQKVLAEVTPLQPDYRFDVILDSDFSD